MRGRSIRSAVGIGFVALVGGFACFTYWAADAVASTTAPSPAPNLVVNGAFAVPPPALSNGLLAFLSPQGYTVNKLPVKRIHGWSIGEGLTNGVPTPNAGGVVVFQNKRLQAPNGSAQSLELSNNGPGNIAEIVKTTPGSTYLLSWYGAGYPDGKSVKIIDASWNNAKVAEPSFKGGTNANMGWILHREVVKATASTSTLEFADGTSPTDPYGPFVGAVSVTKQKG